MLIVTGIVAIFPLLVPFMYMICAALRADISHGSQKGSQEIEGVALASRIVADAVTILEAPLHKLSPSSVDPSAMVVGNLTTQALDVAIHKFLTTQGATAAPLLYGGLTGSLLRPNEWSTGKRICNSADAIIAIVRRVFCPELPPIPFCGFPAHSCISVNSEVGHGVPSAKVLRAGDLVKIDVAAWKDGFLGDTCVTWIAGGEDAAEPRSLEMVEVAREALFLGILAAGSVNRTFGDIGHAVQMHAEASGFTVNPTFCGHGVGRFMHETPVIDHKGWPGHGGLIEENLVFTIEPVLHQGRDKSTVAADGWTVVTQDASLSAQWEHTVTTTKNGVRILTLRHGEKWPLRLASQEERRHLFERAGYAAQFSSRLEAAAQLLL